MKMLWVRPVAGLGQRERALAGLSLPPCAINQILKKIDLIRMCK
jgi:hypothetical protein